jgi:hypothetical protein
MARTYDTPAGFHPVENLPEGLLAKVPTRHLIGPKKGLLGGFLGTYQTAKKIGEGEVRGGPAWTFDYTSKERVTQGEDEHTNTIRSAVLVIDRGGSHPGLSIRDRSGFSKVFDRWTSPGWELGDPEFDRQFLIHANDEANARQFFNEQVRAHLLGLARGHNWDVGGRWLVLWKKGRGGHDDLVTAATGLLHYLPPSE